MMERESREATVKLALEKYKPYFVQRAMVGLDNAALAIEDEVKLAIVHCAGQYDEAEVQGFWQEIIEKDVRFS